MFGDVQCTQIDIGVNMLSTFPPISKMTDDELDNYNAVRSLPFELAELTLWDISNILAAHNIAHSVSAEHCPDTPHISEVVESLIAAVDYNNERTSN